MSESQCTLTYVEAFCFHECRSRMILIGDDLAESITVLERNGYRRSRDRHRREEETQETTLPSGSSKAGNGDRLPREVLAARREDDPEDDLRGGVT